jgi:hypothetical protein
MPYRLQLTHPPAIKLDKPDCPDCGAAMWLRLIEPDEPGHDRRTFACVECRHQVTTVVKYR